MSGKIVRVNEALRDKPELVNSDPYGEGWMLVVELSDPAEAEKLMDADAYTAFVEAGGHCRIRVSPSWVPFTHLGSHHGVSSPEMAYYACATYMSRRRSSGERAAAPMKRTVKTGAMKAAQTARISASDAACLSPNRRSPARRPGTRDSQDHGEDTGRDAGADNESDHGHNNWQASATLASCDLRRAERASAAGGRLEELLRRATLAHGAGHSLDRRGGSGLRLSDRRDTAGPGEPARRGVSGVCAVGPLVPTPTATPKPKVPAPGVNPGQQAIIDKITAVFGSYAPGAINIARCESGFDPNARNVIAIGGSHASGVFQILYPSTWNGTSYKSYSPYDADANIHAAYEIFHRDGNSWREWACRP